MYCIPDVHIAICVKGKNNTYISGRQFYIRVKKGIDVDIHGERAQSLIMVVHNCFYGFELKSSYLETVLLLLRPLRPLENLVKIEVTCRRHRHPTWIAGITQSPPRLTQYVVRLRTRPSSFPRPFQGLISLNLTFAQRHFITQGHYLAASQESYARNQI